MNNERASENSSSTFGAICEMDEQEAWPKHDLFWSSSTISTAVATRDGNIAGVRHDRVCEAHQQAFYPQCSVGETRKNYIESLRLYFSVCSFSDPGSPRDRQRRPVLPLSPTSSVFFFSLWRILGRCRQAVCDETTRTRTTPS